MLEPSKFTPSRPGADTPLVLIVIGALIIVAGVGFVAGFITANAARLGERETKFAAFYEAWDYINDEFYYEKPPNEDRVRGAIQGLVDTLDDRYTLLMEPQRAASDAVLMSGESGGIGAKVKVDTDSNIVIAEVLFGKPAYQAGVESGDILIAADGVKLRGLSTADAIKYIRGAIGSQVSLTVQRGAEERTFQITRDQINVFGRLLPDRLGYVSLSLFDSKSVDQLTEALKPILAENPRALIFDLRGNPGGYLDQAVKVADLFLTEGLIVREKTSAGENKTFDAKNGQIAEEIPLIVLVDQDSASASEIVAGALRDRGRAVLIGQTTFGKGSVQSLHKLADGSQLRVTSGAWYTPNDTPIQNVGLPVSLWVTTPEVFLPGTDPILDAAVDYLIGVRRETF